MRVVLDCKPAYMSYCHVYTNCYIVTPPLQSIGQALPYLHCAVHEQFGKLHQLLLSPTTCVRRLGLLP